MRVRWKYFRVRGYTARLLFEFAELPAWRSRKVVWFWNFLNVKLFCFGFAWWGFKMRANVQSSENRLIKIEKTNFEFGRCREKRFYGLWNSLVLKVLFKLWSFLNFKLFCNWRIRPENFWLTKRVWIVLEKKLHIQVRHLRTLDIAHFIVLDS